MPNRRSQKPISILVGCAVLMLWIGCATTQKTTQKAATTSGPAEGEHYAWVQLGAGTNASARAIVAASSSCPEIVVDGDAVPMKERAAAAKDFETIRVCEFPLDTANPPNSLSIGAKELPIPRGAAKRFAVLGDSGCRANKWEKQDCDGDPADGAWGFPEVAASAAETARDLTIHVGDYLYREEAKTGTECPDCGLGWTTWEADFFAPASEGGILDRTPWILARGNHEDCERAWLGYALFFDPDEYSSTCAEKLDPISIDFDGLQIYLTDTSSKDAELAQEDFSWIAAQETPESAWIVTHVPICKSFDCSEDMGEAFVQSGLAKAEKIQWLLAGHIHYFLQIDGAPLETGARPPVSIVGGSGAKMYDCPEASDETYCFGDDGAASGDGNYSFLLIESHSEHWRAELRDRDGKERKTFQIER